MPRQLLSITHAPPGHGGILDVRDRRSQTPVRRLLYGASAAATGPPPPVM